MAVNRVRVNVYNHVLYEMNLPGGPIWKWTNRLMNEVEVTASTLAPRRTGRLANTLRASTTPVGQLGIQGTVTTRVYYAMWVHKGTGNHSTSAYGLARSLVSRRGTRFGAITSRHGKMMPIPAWGRYRAFYAGVVSGQKPQPFLRDALITVMVANHLT